MRKENLERNAREIYIERLRTLACLAEQEAERMAISKDHLGDTTRLEPILMEVIESKHRLWVLASLGP